MQAVFADVCNEIADLRREATHLTIALDRTRKVDGDAQWSWEQTHVRASAIEKIYTGCERIMARLASAFDDTAVSHLDGWHATLLKRLAQPIPDVRAAIISPPLYKRLDRLRSFRHRERNSYGIDLDADIVFERAEEAISTVEIFRSEVTAFLVLQGFDPASLQQN